MLQMTRRKNAPWEVRGGRSVWPSALGKMHWGRGWALLHMLLTAWGVVVLGITPSGVPLRWGRRRTVPRGMQNMLVYLPQGLAVLSLSTAPLRGLQPSFSACYFILHSLASQGGAVQQCDSQIFFVLGYATSSVCEYGLMYACVFSCAWKSDWARTKPSCIDVQFPWSDGCLICRYSPHLCPHGGLGRNLSWAWREQWGEGSPPQLACRSPCCQADGSHVLSQLEGFHAHGSIPKYKEF